MMEQFTNYYFIDNNKNKKREPNLRWTGYQDCHTHTKKGNKNSLWSTAAGVILMPFQLDISSISAFSMGTYVTTSWFS